MKKHFDFLVTTTFISSGVIYCQILLSSWFFICIYLTFKDWHSNPQTFGEFFFSFILPCALIEALPLTILIGLYLYYKSHKLLMTLAIALIVYLLLLFAGALYFIWPFAIFIGIILFMHIIAISLFIKNHSGRDEKCPTLT